jgi:hypothetical protein
VAVAVGALAGAVLAMGIAEDEARTAAAQDADPPPS